MAEKTGTSGAAGRAPSAGQPDGVRNVVLVGHSGAGKTTLVEALLVATGTIQRPGRVEDGTTVSDFDEVEVRQQRSVNLTLAPSAGRRGNRRFRLRTCDPEPAGKGWSCSSRTELTRRRSDGGKDGHRRSRGQGISGRPAR